VRSTRCRTCRVAGPRGRRDRVLAWCLRPELSSFVGAASRSTILQIASGLSRLGRRLPRPAFTGTRTTLVKVAPPKGGWSSDAPIVRSSQSGPMTGHRAARQRPDPAAPRRRSPAAPWHSPATPYLACQRGEAGWETEGTGPNGSPVGATRSVIVTSETKNGCRGDPGLLSYRYSTPTPTCTRRR